MNLHARLRALERTTARAGVRPCRKCGPTLNGGPVFLEVGQSPPVCSACGLPVNAAGEAVRENAKVFVGLDPNRLRAGDPIEARRNGQP